MKKKIIDNHMESEFKSRDFSSIAKYMNGEKKSIKTIENTRWHTTIVYWIPPSGRNTDRLCFQCREQAEFLYFDQDHFSRYFVQLFCKEHGWKDFEEWLNEAK